MLYKLLNTGRFEENEFLYKYIQLISEKQTRYTRNKTNYHHIIPKYYYNDNNIEIDNTSSNLVCLLYKDHLLAHYYLARCSISSKDISRNALAIRFILKGKSLEQLNVCEIDWDYYQQLFELGRSYNIESTHTDEINKRISDKLCSRESPNKRKHPIRKPKKSKRNPNAKNKYLSDLASKRTGEKNSFYGKHHTDETKNKISKINSKKVLMYDLLTGKTIKKFNSIKNASDYIISMGLSNAKCCSSRISKVCRENGINKAYGYGWKFYIEGVSTICDECNS